MAWHVLDTSVLLQGGERPVGDLATTPEAEAEISGGGRDARRFAYWQAAGLQVRAAGSAGLERVHVAAREAGNMGRLSQADLSLLALAVDLHATLWTDDRTMQDIAQRIGLRWHSVREGAIRQTKDWTPRCAGCGRWGGQTDRPCPVCGSAVRLRSRR